MVGHVPAFRACKTVAFFQTPLALEVVGVWAVEDKIEPLYLVAIIVYQVIVPVPAVILYILYPDLDAVSGVMFPALPLIVKPALAADALG
jgi:hypothetical protein